MSSTAPSKTPSLDPLESHYIQGEQLLVAGRVKEAADLCQRMLQQNPGYGRGYFLLSRIYHHTGNLDKAMEFVDQAIRLMPEKDGVMHYMRGNYLLTKGKFDEAEDDMKLAAALEPNFGLAPLLLASIYIHQKNYPAARRYLDDAKRLGLEADALHQESIILMTENRRQEAMETLSRVIALKPDHALSYIRRGELALMMERHDMAAEDSHAALRLNPQNGQAWKLQALIASYQKNHSGAIDALQHAIRLNPNSVELWRMLGNELQLSNQPREAAQAFQQALGRDPEDAYSLNILPALLMGLGHTGEARAYLEKALQQFPDNPVLNHFKSFFDQNSTVERASDEYVQSVFDGYADIFDTHLQQSLQYNTPSLIAQCLQRVLKLSDEQTAAFSLLDLGCGTGLGAAALEAFTRHRVGVDLSPKMIEKARARNLYNHLAVSDLVPYLASAGEAFDIVAAMDVFVYIGNLNPIFDVARRVMKPGSRFAFSIEEEREASENGYTLRSSGRFAHTKAYLHALAGRYGYEIELMESAVIRYEAGKPLDGCIVIFLYP